MPKPKKNAEIPTVARKWHPPLKGAFLEALRTVRFISQACDLAQISRRVVYQWRENDPDFVAAMDEAEQRFVDDIREEVRRRAMGNGGSDELLKFLARSKAPEFRENVGAVAQVHVNFVQLMVGKLQTIIQKVVPIKCPHCEKALDMRASLAAELTQLDAIDVTASAPEGA